MTVWCKELCDIASDNQYSHNKHSVHSVSETVDKEKEVTTISMVTKLYILKFKKCSLLTIKLIKNIFQNRKRT